MDIEDIRSIYGTRTPGVIGEHRSYSVLVPFITPEEEDGGLSLLYEVRAAGVRQPGEVCFPGGHMEEGESPEECAVRETCEELGIKAGGIEVISQGGVLYGSGFTLHVFIGSISRDTLESIEPDPGEVSEVFTVPLDVLMDARPEHYGEKLKPDIDPGFPYERVGIGKDYPWRTASYDIPVYDIAGRVIWGLTARITENVIQTLKKGEKR